MQILFISGVVEGGVCTMKKCIKMCLKKNSFFNLNFFHTKKQNDETIFSHHFRKMDKPSNDSIPVQQKNIRIFTPSSDYMNASVFNLSVLKTRDHASNFRSAMKHFKVKLVIRIRHFMIFFYRVLWADYFFNCR